jgi:hypothetical protein
MPWRKGARSSPAAAASPNPTLGAGHYYAPTVLVDADPEMELAQEETFGPVVPVFRFATEDEAVRLANDTPFGLAAYFYTRDAARIWRVADRWRPASSASTKARWRRRRRPSAASRSRATAAKDRATAWTTTCT